MNKLIYIILLAVVFGSCTKKETREIAIPGNKALPDTTVAQLTIDNYINKSYISLLGRKPTETEMASSQAILVKDNFSFDQRKSFIDEVQSKPDYFPHTYSLSRVDLLNDQDTMEIDFFIQVFNIYLTDSTKMFLWDQLQIEIVRLQELKGISTGLSSGSLQEKDMHRRCVNNFFYDQINMGTANFVISLWQHFLFRYPTDEELAQASKMVDGLNGSVFLTDGYTKNDFMDIFFSSDAYYEGQVRTLYERYLFRVPDSKEMSDEAKQYKTDGSYKELQKRILITNEYAGVE